MRTGHKLGALKALPSKIKVHEEIGHPVVITWPLISQGEMPEHTQKLYATLGVLVRFV